MYPFGGILLAPLVAGYLASVLGRIWRRRGRRPGWMAGGLAICGGVFATWLATFQLDLFMPWRWGQVGGKVDLLFLLAVTGILAAVVGILPAAFIVDRHQRIYDGRDAWVSLPPDTGIIDPASRR